MYAHNSILDSTFLLRAQTLALPLLIILTGINADVAGGSAPHFGAPIGVSGIGRYYPGKWGVVEVQLANPGHDPTTLLPVLSFEGKEEVQFARRVWVPGNARRTSWFPVLPPSTLPAESRSWDIKSLLFDGDSQSETPIPATTGEMQLKSYLLAGRISPLTGLIADPQHLDELMHLLWAARLSRNLPKSVALLDWARLPPTVESLEGLDQLLVASNDILAQPSASSAIRNWLHRGGKLWVHLNTVDPTTIASLVGDALQISVVDRLQRDQLQIYSHELRVKQPSGPELRFDQPVEMMRVVFSNASPSHTVEGWPIAAWTNVGRGTLLITTIGGPAWLRDRTPADLIPDAPDDRNDHVRLLANEPLRELASMFFSERARPPLTMAQLQDYAAEQVGYEIVSRQKVAAVLGLFCLAFMVAWIGLTRIGSLEQIGWIGPLGVVLTTVVLLGIGLASRKSVPKTVAVIETAEASPYADAIQVAGLAATYSAEKSTDRLTANNGGVFWPKLDELGGTVLRMISTDRSHWELHNVVLPAGKHLVPFSQSFLTDEPVRAVGTFGKDGLTGTISAGPFRELTDAILAMPSTRNLAIDLGDAGSFAANADAVLAPGQFLTGGSLSDEQRRRVRMYGFLIASGKGRDPYPTVPTLLAWARPLDLKFRLLDEADQAGSTLVSIPIQLTSPAPGTHIRIPAPFIRYRAAGASMTATYDDRKRTWVGPFPTGRDTTLAFQLPEEVLPITVESARLVIGIKALSRELQVTGIVDGKPVVLDSRRSPLGRVEIQISRDDALVVNDAGELTLGINVGDIRDDEGNRVADPSEAQMWKIDDVQLEITGTTLTP